MEITGIYYFLIFLFITLNPIDAHVDDIFYVDYPTTSSVVIGWWGESDDVVDKVREWSIYVNDMVVYSGTAQQLSQDGQREVGDGLTAGEKVYIKVRVIKDDETYVYPLDNKPVRLEPLPVTKAFASPYSGRNDQVGRVKLSWTPAENSIQDKYRVRFKGQKADWSQFQETRLNEMTYTNLTPGDQYRFEIYAISDNTSSEPVELIATLYPGHVTNVNVPKYPGGSTLEISWTKPPGLVHRIEVQQLEAVSGCCFYYSEGSVHDDFEGANLYLFEAGVSYRIQISAVGVDGKKGHVVEVPVTIAPKIESTLELIGEPEESSVTFSYTQSNTTFDNYVIKVLNGDKAKDVIVKSKTDPNRQVTFANLAPGTHYEAAFYSRVEERPGTQMQWSHPYTFNFKTAGEAASESTGSESSDTPGAAVYAMAVVIAILLVLIIILAVMVLRYRRQRHQDTVATDKPANNISVGYKNNVLAASNQGAQTDVERNERPLPEHPALRPKSSATGSYMEVQPGYEEPVHRDQSHSIYSKPYEKLQYDNNGKPYETLDKNVMNSRSYDNKLLG